MEQKVIGDAADITHMLPKFDWHSAWSSPEKFGAHVEKLKPAWEDAGWTESERFTKTKNMEEAIKLSKDAWPEGRRMVAGMRDKVLSRWPLRKKPIKYGVVGSVPCVPRAVAGDPNNMMDYGSAHSRKRPVITLVSDMCASYNISAETICNRSAVIAAIVDQIESQGYACEVIAMCVSNSNEKRGFRANVSVRLKEAGVPVDTGRLAFGLGHASMFRRFVFAAWGSDRDCKLGCGLGHVVGLSKEEQKEMAERKFYYVKSLQNCSEKFDTPEKAMTEGLEWQIGELRQLGCPAFAEEKKELAQAT